MTADPKGGGRPSPGPDGLATDLSRYIREKVDQLFVTMGSKPLRADELDDRSLLALDPIGTVSVAFGQILEHLREVNARLMSEMAERERAQNALRESEDRFRTLAEFSTSWVFWRGPDGRLVYVSPATETITGYAPWEFYRDPELALRIIAPGDRERWSNHCHAADAEGNPEYMEFEIVTKAGERRWILHQCRPVYGDKAEFLGVRGSNRDITNRKRMEFKLRESEEFLRDIIDNALDLIQVVAADGRFVLVNRAWCEALGYTAQEAASMSICDIVPPELHSRCETLLRLVMAGEKVGGIELTFVARDGRRIAVEGHATCKTVDGWPVAMRSIFRDVTDKKRLEDELLKARKLESIGVLAGGIAHDFNNLLTAILGNISLARVQTAPGGEIARRLDDAEAASLRAKELTGQLLTFAHGGAPVRQAVSMGDLVREVAASALPDGKIRCEIVIPGNLPPVEADPAQIGQALQSILENAAEAMPGGGVVTVRASISDSAECGNGAPGEPHFVLSVEDRGVGIPKEQVGRIFDPFYTTKPNGTGLGLSAAYSIVRSHGGTIAVSSEPGAGSTFAIRLPLTSTADEGPGAGEAGAVRTAVRKVLVMDDEEAVREVAVHMLSFIGCQATAVRDGAEAISAYRNARDSGAPFDAVIMDLNVPGGMGGKEAVAKLRGIDPNLRAIVSSGYSNDPILSDFRAYGFQAMVAKPYRTKDLSEALRRVLNGGG